MNRSPSNSLAHSRAITGFLNFKSAEGLTSRSIDSYKHILEQWAKYAGEVQVRQLSPQDIDHYLVYLRNEYVPRQFGRETRKEYWQYRMLARHDLSNSVRIHIDVNTQTALAECPGLDEFLEEYLAWADRRTSLSHISPSNDNG